MIISSANSEITLLDSKENQTKEGTMSPNSYTSTISSNRIDCTSMNSTENIDFVDSFIDVYQVINLLPDDSKISDNDIYLLNQAEHPAPFNVLGYQKFGEDDIYEYFVVRAWIRNAKVVHIRGIPHSCTYINNNNEAVHMERRNFNGNNWLFEKAFRIEKTRYSRNMPHYCRKHNNKELNNIKDKENNDLTSINISQTNPSSTLTQSSSSIPKETVTLEGIMCSSDIACNTYIHDNNDSENCPRKLYYEYLVIYEGDPEEKKYCIRDTYSFGLLLPDYEMSLFQSGSCWHVDNTLGSHIIEYNGVKGVRFSIWAPNARFVSVVGDLNGWDGRAHPMRQRYGYGIWELFIPHIPSEQKYGYQIHSITGSVFVKIDPYAQEFEIPPQYASIISSCDDAYKNKEDRFKWEDEEWIKKRSSLGIDNAINRQPISIYEVHLPSWMRNEDGNYLSYREVADRLVNHIKNLNFTHVEFLPLVQHPFEGSWGYQITGQYSVYSRLGDGDDFKYLVNELHKADIGVFIDFVPGHFCKDSWGLVYYDGTPTYEYGDPKEGEHKQWGTAVFNYRRNEVRSFLLGASYHWLRRYHIDGLRIDAVSSMLYRNYLRPNGEWIPNEFGGDANLEAISLLKELNWVIHKEFPGVFTMAEESTAWNGVSIKQNNSLGFNAKWDLGWMNDTLSYLYTPPDRKPSKHNKLTFRGLYMPHENWVLPLSHDEVVNGKGSLLDKCGFSNAPFMDRIRTLKALFGYQIGVPGRPLIFQGAEIAQGREWKETRSVDWHEGGEDCRKKVCIFLSDLLYLYKTKLSLHAGDDEAWNFQWVDCDNAQDCVVGFIRKYKDWYNDIVIFCNFSGRRYYNYPIGVPHGGEWNVLINSDDWKYGGSMFGPGNNCKVKTTHGGRIGWEYCLWIDISEFSCIYLQPPQPNDQNNQDKTHIESIGQCCIGDNDQVEKETKNLSNIVIEKQDQKEQIDNKCQSSNKQDKEETEQNENDES